MKRKAFTLIELLVVIAIIAVLMGILMPALRKVREQARQRECGGRVRQLVLSSVMYGDDYDTKLPRPTTGGNWLQDVAISQVHHMLDTGMTREMFYCPTNHNQQIENDAFWQFNNASWDGSRFTDYTAGSFIVSGYLFIVELAESAPGQRRSEANPIQKYDADPVQPIWLKTTQEGLPSVRELVADAILGGAAPDSEWGFRFEAPGGIAAGMAASGVGQGLNDQSSHMKNEFEIYGGNVGYLDGHVEWHTFNPQRNASSGNAIPRVFIGQNWFW